MSVRIYQLSKKTGMKNSAVIEILKKRGYLIKNASSTIDNISAESFIQEFGPKEAVKQAKEKAPENLKSVDFSNQGDQKEKKKSEKPSKIMVKTKEEVERERSHEGGKMPLHSSPIVSSGGFASQNASFASKKAPALSTASISKREKSAPQVTIKATMPEPVSPVRPPSDVDKDTNNGSPNAAQALTPDLPKSRPDAVRLPYPGRSSPAAAPKVPTLQPSGVQAPSDSSQLKTIQVKPPIVVREFAKALDIKPFRLISLLMENGIFASMNQTIDEAMAAKIAETQGYTLEIKHRGESQAEKLKKKQEQAADKPENLKLRPPVVCVIGHVDHGKTTLLDTIRKTSVVKSEAGGITQHMGAYQVMHSGQAITFIDTPGHAAFSKMRARGVHITDVAILVIAADDGFKPQTEEALKFAQKANVPIIVAINKIDAKGANVDRVKMQMQEKGIGPEDWGYDTITVPVSALKGGGIDELLEMVLLQAEVMELKANPKADVQAIVMESQIEQGRGPTASIIVQKGTLKTGDSVVCGPFYCKVRSMIDSQGKTLKEAGPSAALKVIGWSGTPEAGGLVTQAKNERDAKRQAEDNEFELKAQLNQKKNPGGFASKEAFKAFLDQMGQNEQKVLKVILKGDVAGTVEALEQSLSQIQSDKVKLEIVAFDVGPITKNDVTLAATAQADIVGFNTKLENGVHGQAKHDSVRIYQHNIIYELIDMVKEAMADLIEPELKQVQVGACEVRQVFNLSSGTVAGCMVQEGKIIRDHLAHLVRGGEIVHEGRIGTLKRFKDDASEVRSGYECGVAITGVSDYKEGDRIECFRLDKIKPKL